MKLKQYEVVTQPEYLKSPLQDILRKYRTIKQWAYILHDKDKDASSHYHIYINFGQQTVDSKDVAGWFGIPEQFVNKVEGRKTDMLMYLTHSNDSQQHKHQYDFSEVVANFDFKSEIEQAKIIGDFENTVTRNNSTIYTRLPFPNSRNVSTVCKNYGNFNVNGLALIPT